jgi:hypothetical protein
MAMKYLNDFAPHVGAECASDAEPSVVMLKMQLAALDDRLRELLAHHDPLQRARLQLDKGRVLVELGRGAEAWDIAREAFDAFVAAEQWEQAVDACDVLFLSDQPGSLGALGQGVWLAVTYPIDPELTLAVLQHIVDETPDDSDGAAVAATMAAYVVDLRAQGKQREMLGFFANQLLGTVARRHANIETQADFERWFKRLELDDPQWFLPRLRNVIDVLVQDDWWIDRDALRARLPVN